MADQEPESQSAETSEEQASAETPQNASNAEGAEPDSGDTAVEKSTESKEPENTESDTPNTVLPDELPAEAEGSATKEVEYSATKQTEDDTTKETEDGATKETEDGATKETEDGSTKQTEDGATKQTEDGEVVTVEQSEEAGEAPAEDPTKQAATPEQGKVQEEEIKADVVAEEGTGDTGPGQVAEEPQEVVNQPAETADEAAAPRSVSQSPAVLTEVAVKEGEPDLLEGDLPQPGTPEKEGSIAGEEELLMVEEEEPVPEYNREELLQQYQAALQEREQLNTQNRNLQHRLSDYYSKKKSEESRQEVDKNASDQEQRYMKYMSNIEELRQQQAVERQVYNEQLEEMKEKKMEKQKRVDEEWSKSIEFKKAVALAAINSRSGRPIHPKDLEVYEANEKKKEGEVSQVRLENIKLKNRLKKQESQLKQKEELAEGLHLIDFEQLKIENQTYNEKIEERNEELLKLRKKITSTVQVLTHLKEKLQFVQAENFIGKEQLSDVEKDVAQKRDILSRTKQARDALRHENNKLQQKCGLLGNTDLLRDFEVGTDEADSLEVRLDMLKRVHAELTLNLNGIKKKIELAKENQS